MLLCRNDTGRGDDFVRGGRGDIVKELLGGCGKLGVFLCDQHKGALHSITAVLDRGLTGSHATHGNRLNTVFDGSERSVANGAGVAGNGRDYVAGRGQFLPVLTGVFGIGDGFKTVTGTGSGFTADQNDRFIITADFVPVGNLTGINFGNLLQCKIRYRICRVDNDGDAVISQNRLDQAVGLFGSFRLRLERPMSPSGRFDAGRAEVGL